MAKKKPRKMASLSWKKKIIFSIITLSISLIVLELCCRVFFAFYVGPSVLLYGTPFQRQEIKGSSSVSGHEKMATAKAILGKIGRGEWNKRRTVEIPQIEDKGYLKYFPNQKKNDFDMDTGERFDVTINSRGFRGREFTDEKKTGVIRIVCLGASSTFGYFDKDDQTYPVYLEQKLNEKYSGNAKFEVINLGIPLLRSFEIYNLFMQEVIPLKPDLITYYEGSNDSDPPEEWLTMSLLHHRIKRVGRVSMLARFIDSMFSRYHKILYPSLASKEIEDISNNYINYIAKIYEECRKRGIVFVVASQQKNSTAFDRETQKHLTYKEEVALIQDKFEKSGALIHPELAFLIHSVLMDRLKSWAKENQVPFVDIIAKLDHDRDVLVSWVHLNAKGNRMVAEALAEKILQHDWEQHN